MPSLFINKSYNNPFDFRSEKNPVKGSFLIHLVLQWEDLPTKVFGEKMKSTESEEIESGHQNPSGKRVFN